MATERSGCPMGSTQRSWFPIARFLSLLAFFPSLKISQTVLVCAFRVIDADGIRWLAKIIIHLERWCRWSFSEDLTWFFSHFFPLPRIAFRKRKKGDQSSGNLTPKVSLDDLIVCVLCDACDRVDILTSDSRSEAFETKQTTATQNRPQIEERRNSEHSMNDKTSRYESRSARHTFKN